MAFVLDNSVAVAWCFEDEQNPYTQSVLEALHGSEAVVPTVWLLEAPNALLMAARRGRIAVSMAHTLLGALLDLPITVAPELQSSDAPRLLMLAHEYALSTYDAAYIDLGLRLGLPVATQDRAMVAAAERLGIPILGASA
jgi:predicted nucleic acid-binding protein